MNTKMKNVIRASLYFNGLAEAFDEAQDFHLRLVNDPWLSLVVERHGDEVSVTHYVERGGDPTRDPEMVFSLAEWEALSGGLFRGWVPKSTEPGGFGRVYPTGQVVQGGDEPPRLLYFPRAMKDALHFAGMWARNLREQGFVRRYEAGQITSLTHPDALSTALAHIEVPIRIRHSVQQVGEHEEHLYRIPDDLPRKLVPLAYRQAAARLKADWPDWGRYGYGTTPHGGGQAGQGLVLTTRLLPECTCVDGHQE